MIYLKYFVLVMMVFLVVGCGTKDPISPNNQTISYIMPLKIGNAWSYDMEIYSGPSLPPQVVYDYIMAVIDTVTINNEKWYRTVLAVPEVTWADTVYFTNRASGLFLRMTTAINDSVYLRFKYPARVGDTSSAAQEFLIGEFGFRSNPAELMSTNASVTVPYGIQSCHYQYINLDPGSQNPVYLDDYFKPNLGMVKSDLRIYDGAYYSYFVWKLRQAVLQ